MYESFFIGTSLVFQPLPIIVIFLGVLVGLVVGSIPGLTAAMAIAITAPLTFSMAPTVAMPLLMGIYCGGVSGGLVTAILLNIPGTPSSAATTLDGFPMARKGEVLRALGLGIYSSMIGGAIAGLILVVGAPLLAKAALLFGPWEYFMLVVFTFTCISAMASHGQVLKAFLGAALGMALAMIGVDEANGLPRMTFGSDVLLNGFSALPALIGVFAVPQLLSDADNIGKESTVLKVKLNYKLLFKSLYEVLKNKLIIFKSVFIGVVIGILPGIGPGLSNIVAYGSARNSSAHPELYGKGVLAEAIIAPETANNASMGGALLPMLTLGIPGDASTLMMLSAFMLQGLVPGPLLFRDHSDIIWVVLISYFLAFIFCTILYHLYLPIVSKVLKIPSRYMIPSILVMCVIGSYALNNSMFDVYTFMAFGVLGYLLHLSNVPVLPVILGLILGPMAESNLKSALTLADGSLLPFITRPISLCLLLIAIISVLVPMIRKKSGGVAINNINE